MIFQRRRHKRPISILSRPYSSVSDTITFSPAIITEIHQNFSTAARGTDGLYVIVYVSIHFQVEIEKKKRTFRVFLIHSQVFLCYFPPLLGFTKISLV